jgi:iron transport multicopper oxidase
VSAYTPESAKMCTFSCIGDTTQACGGQGTYISIYYDRTKYTPDAGAIPLSSTATGPVTTPTGIATGPLLLLHLPQLPSVGAYTYVGCYSEATTGRALTGKAYANDSMTIEICAVTCSGYTWWGVEYARECKSFNTPEDIDYDHSFLETVMRVGL